MVVHRYKFIVQETIKTFEKYGIRESILPIELGGPVSFDYDTWLETRRSVEEERDENRRH